MLKAIRTVHLLMNEWKWFSQMYGVWRSKVNRTICAVENWTGQIHAIGKHKEGERQRRHRRRQQQQQQRSMIITTTSRHHFRHRQRWRPQQQQRTRRSKQSHRSVVLLFKKKNNVIAITNNCWAAAASFVNELMQPNGMHDCNSISLGITLSITLGNAINWNSCGCFVTFHFYWFDFHWFMMAI